MNAERLACVTAFGTIAAAFMMKTTGRPGNISVHFLMALLSEGEPEEFVFQDVDTLGYFDGYRGRFLKPIYDLFAGTPDDQPLTIPPGQNSPISQLIATVWSFEVRRPSIQPNVLLMGFHHRSSLRILKTILMGPSLHDKKLYAKRSTSSCSTARITSVFPL